MTRNPNLLICNVVGARPNFMKMAPIVKQLQHRGIPQHLIHTGQHYDAAMSGVFFDELDMPRPDVHLGVGSGTHAQQTARVLTAFEDYCLEQKPSMVVVAGDVNSTVACAMAAAKLGIPVAHVEAGLRSFDRSMPEELNRIVTDHLSDLLFTTEESGNRNLCREGIESSKICFAGNCMVDSLREHQQEALRRKPWGNFNLDENEYALITLHRPSNVDCEERLQSLVEMAGCIGERMPVIFPVHPRTRERLSQLDIPIAGSIQFVAPLPYLAFLGLMARARVVLTDSGGIQEETTALEIPCLTLRNNTERPSTIDCGTNVLVGENLERVPYLVDRIARGDWKKGSIPPLWDGHAAKRVVHRIELCLGNADLMSSYALGA